MISDLTSTSQSDYYKLVSRDFHPENSVICGIGGNKPIFIAGPCAVESEEQILRLAELLKNLGATHLRGGAFKARTSPYTFQGLGKEGIIFLKKAKEKTGLPLVSEIVSSSDIKLFEDSVDIIQVGARNMQNYELLKSLSRIKTPILLKRAFCATVDEWLMSAEYIMAGGNENVILCERGIRTFETATRYTLDLSAIAIVKQKSHLPILVDPSHAAGNRDIVEPLCYAAMAVGADGIMTEVHENPPNALSDGQQAITPEMYKRIIKTIKLTKCDKNGMYNNEA